ncbi:hypothetical protein EJ05DRAFT_526567 [Pseudovirgaria hyperparasitica]|uniref:GPI inositol-deacylase n=1 Tax=Pseudovirgaria hyperparasitica TaxID=470096 RepID=A0A6A6WB18_9PEZI|nr:uncharacterized protein EJ05DRAFT_526567 [Pseudovirgaria hyperparasitica]KAF2759863.1 hypothetical protein EJ05DRAFT_526567 [Pseudovirgaria hyperparasitica]
MVDEDTDRVVPPTYDRCRSSGTSSRLSSKNGFSLQRSFSILSRTKSEDTLVSDDVGPYGLTLLHEPPEPLIDFIFVHGLRGGSVKTWRKESDDQYFWPQAWLPQEQRMQHARIHTFGYNSDWGERRESFLNVHDFGRYLLGEMSTSPYLRSSPDSPIVLIGHSMGGLVIKKAYILARRDKETKELAARIQCLIFLATPHRGASLASLLNNMLRATGVFSVKPFLADLEKNSPGLDMINDDFRHYADEVRLWSFYETVKLNLGIQSALVVERDSATIGLKHERVQLLNADHRSVCKYDSTHDPNYVAVKNALIAIAEDILGATITKRFDDQKQQLSDLQTYLAVRDKPIDELNTEQDIQAPGSCSWIQERQSFQTWIETPQGELYWVHAQPATGKTILTGHVITELLNAGHDCCYYFFKTGQKGKNTISAMLRSFAFQMGLMHPIVRLELAKSQERNPFFDRDDERAIWRKFFAGGILKLPLGRPQYWIIDGLDECIDPTRIFPLISRIESSYPVQFFITSRPWLEFDRQFARLGKRVIIDPISIENTIGDIKLFIEDNMNSLPVNGEADRERLVQNLIDKSGGCFLWAHLILKELQSVYSEEYIERTIDELPTEMSSMYERILQEMSCNVREKRLAKSLLVWTMCAVRSLRIDELASAIKTDADINVRNIEKSIQGLCGQLLRTDKAGCVQPMHMTIKAFLTDRSLQSEFAVSKEAGNNQLALACLRYLSGEEMKPPRHRTIINVSRPTKSAIADYACVAFSDHLASASSMDHDLFLVLERFLRTNILTWIEYIAGIKKNLYYLIRTAKNLQKYLHRRAKHTPPFGDAFQCASQWSTDLVRLVAKFGANLLNVPSSIYYLITPFCPRTSSIYRYFSDTCSGLTVHGLENDSWEDSICYIDFREHRAMSVAAGDNTFAIGTKSGRIFLYWQVTCQERLILNHGEAARCLRFDNNNRIACAGPHEIQLWDINSRELLWTYVMKDTPVLLQFSGSDEVLIAATRQSHAVKIDCKDGCVVSDQAYPNRQAPLDIAISPDQSIIAFAYRGKPVLLWSLDNDRLLGACGGTAGAEAQAMISDTSPEKVIFNSNPAVELMVVTFQNGSMVLYETWNQRAVKAAQQDCHYLACSPDGRTLATGSSWGYIGLWDFETLSLLYQINTRETLGKALSFTGDGTRIIELKDRKAKIWEPAALVRKVVEEESNISESVSMPPLLVGTGNDIVPITSTRVHSIEEVILVGKDDGSMSLYSSVNGQKMTDLYSHKQDIFVRYVAVGPGRMVASVDASNRVLVYDIEMSTNESSVSTQRLLLDSKFDDSVQQIVFNETEDKLLVSTTCRDYLFVRITKEHTFKHVTVIEASARTLWRWLSSIRVPGTIVLVTDCIIRRYAWDTLEVVHTGQSDTRIDVGATALTGADLAFKNLVTDHRGSFLIAEFAHKLGSKATERLVVWRTSSMVTQVPSPGSGGADATLILTSKDINHFLGCFEQRIVFLDHNLWVCSIDLSQLHGTQSSLDGLIKKHFFIPREFVGGNEGNMGSVTRRGSIVFPKEGEIAVVSNGLQWTP